MEVHQVFLLLLSVVSVKSACFFPTEIQGSYAVQYVEGDSSDIWYKSVSIAYDYISGLGECIYRQTDKYVLKSDDGCFKCVGLKQRSFNVLTLSQTDLCHASPDAAWRQCESDQDSDYHVKESSAMLYRAGNKIKPSQCPITGKFRVNCENGHEETRGEADTCPDESLLRVSCPGREELSFQCLGHWTGEDGRQYLSLLDRVLPQVGEEARPRWRCAVYQETGEKDLTLTLSSDSTCDNLSQEIKMTRHLPKSSFMEETDVVLPEWVQGSWDSVTVSGGHIVHRSAELLTTHHMTAVQSHHHGLYTVKVTTECGVKGFACLDIMGRGEHESGKILELRLGQIYDHRHEVRCGLRQDKQLVKVTQLRHRQECPMPGEWQGEIPDGEGLCARSVTTCGAPFMMKYQVYNCLQPNEVYEDRLYECYGQYSHGGQVYTLTKRLDLQERQECFVGVTTDGGQHRIMEAGEHCERGKQPQLYGMVMEPVQTLSCDSSYEENSEADLQIEMRLLHPKLTLKTNVLMESFEDNNSLETSARSVSKQDLYTSGSSSSSFSVISLASLILALLYSL